MLHKVLFSFCGRLVADNVVWADGDARTVRERVALLGPHASVLCRDDVDCLGCRLAENDAGDSGQRSARNKVRATRAQWIRELGTIANCRRGSDTDAVGVTLRWKGFDPVEAICTRAIATCGLETIVRANSPSLARQ